MRVFGRIKRERRKAGIMSEKNGKRDPDKIRVSVEVNDEQWSALVWLVIIAVVVFVLYAVPPAFDWPVTIGLLAAVALVACICRRCRPR